MPWIVSAPSISAIVPLLLLVCIYGLYSGLRDRSDYRPFFSSLGFFVLCFAGIGISFYPFIICTDFHVRVERFLGDMLGFLPCRRFITCSCSSVLQV